MRHGSSTNRANTKAGGLVGKVGGISIYSNHDTSIGKANKCNETMKNTEISPDLFVVVCRTKPIPSNLTK